MPAQIPDSIADWSTTAGSNQPSGSANVGPDLDDNLRAMQAAVRQTYTRGSIASAATCDIGTVDAELITVTGTTGISSLGTTLGATGYGVHKVLTFAGALTLTNSASLACITSANITTAAGDSCMVEFSASGWTMLWYQRKDGTALIASPTFLDGTVGTPGIRWASDTNTGFYRIGADNMGVAANGALVFEWSGSLTRSYQPLRAPAGSSNSVTGLQIGQADRGFWWDGGQVLTFSNSSYGAVFNHTANTGQFQFSCPVRVVGNFAQQSGTTTVEKLAFNGTLPSLSGGGTGASIAGSRNGMRVTIGTGSPTTFSVQYAGEDINGVLSVLSSQAGLTWSVTRTGGTDTTFQFNASAALTAGTVVYVTFIQS